MVVAGRASDPNSLLCSDKVSQLTMEQTPRPRTGNIRRINKTKNRWCIIVVVVENEVNFYISSQTAASNEAGGTDREAVGSWHEQCHCLSPLLPLKMSVNIHWDPNAACNIFSSGIRPVLSIDQIYLGRSPLPVYRSRANSVKQQTHVRAAIGYRSRK